VSGEKRTCSTTFSPVFGKLTEADVQRLVQGHPRP